jgi:hypothetical protein
MRGAADHHYNQDAGTMAVYAAASNQVVVTPITKKGHRTPFTMAVK